MPFGFLEEKLKMANIFFNISCVWLSTILLWFISVCFLFINLFLTFGLFWRIRIENTSYWGEEKICFFRRRIQKKLLSIVLLFYSIFQDQKISQLGSALNCIFKIWGGPIRKILKCHKKFIAKLLISEVYFSRVFKKALFSLCTIFYSNISWYSYFVTININYNIYSVDYVKKCVVLHTIMIDL